MKNGRSPTGGKRIRKVWKRLNEESKEEFEKLFNAEFERLKMAELIDGLYLNKFVAPQLLKEFKNYNDKF